MVKISVIIPTYKPEKYIYDCLKSLEKQTISKDFFEVIIVLNGDKQPYYDDIYEHISHIKMKVKLIYTEKKGVSNARNIGLDLMRGSYVVFLDDDDILSPNYLKNMLKIAQDNTLCISNLVCFDNDSKKQYLDYIGKNFVESIKSDNVFKMRKFTSAIGGKLIPISVIGMVRFDDNFSNGEDSLFMAEISKNISSYITTERNTIYYRRVRKESLSKQKNIFLKIANSFKLVLRYSCLLLKKEYDPIYILSRILAQFKNIFNNMLGYFKQS